VHDTTLAITEECKDVEYMPDSYVIHPTLGYKIGWIFPEHNRRDHAIEGDYGTIATRRYMPDPSQVQRT